MEQAAVHISRVATPKKQQPFFGKKKEPAFFAPALIQPKLTIAPVNDPYETEADAVADKVMLQAKPSPLTIQRKCDACEAEEKLHRKEDEEDSMQPLQMKPAADFSIQRKCDACGEEHEIHRMANDEEEPVQLKAINSLVVQRQCAACGHEEQEVHRKESASSATPNATPAVRGALRTQGRPLDAGTKHFMESRFGQDFSDVQIHNDSLAHQSSKEINAKAYTHGQHIVFGEGQYQPETYAGKQLLAHELTHVVQQNGMVGRGLNNDLEAAGTSNVVQRKEAAPLSFLAHADKCDEKPAEEKKKDDDDDNETYTCAFTKEHASIFPQPEGECPPQKSQKEADQKLPETDQNNSYCKQLAIKKIGDTAAEVKAYLESIIDPETAHKPDATGQKAKEKTIAGDLIPNAHKKVKAKGAEPPGAKQNSKNANGLSQLDQVRNEVILFPEKLFDPENMPALPSKTNVANIDRFAKGPINSRSGKVLDFVDSAQLQVAEIGDQGLAARQFLKKRFVIELHNQRSASQHAKAQVHNSHRANENAIKKKYAEAVLSITGFSLKQQGDLIADTALYMQLFSIYNGMYELHTRKNFAEAQLYFLQAGSKYGNASENQAEKLAIRYDYAEDDTPAVQHRVMFDESDGILDGKLTANRYEARAKTARQVGASYKSSFIEQSLTQSNKVDCGLDAGIAAGFDILGLYVMEVDCFLELALAEMNEQFKASLQACNEVYSALMDSAEELKNHGISAIDEQSQLHPGILTELYHKEDEAIETDTALSQRTISEGAANVAMNLLEEMEIYQEELLRSSALGDEALNKLRTSFEQEWDSDFTKQVKLLKLSAGTTKVLLAEAQQTLGQALNDVTIRAEESNNAVVDGSRQLLGNLRRNGTTVLNEVTQINEKSIADIYARRRKELVELNKQADKMLRTDVPEKQRKDLEQQTDCFEHGIYESLQKDFDKTVCNSAEKAAKQVKPRWKLWAKIIVIIALALIGGWAIGAVLLAGLSYAAVALAILIGAAFGVTSKVAENLIDGEKWHKGIVTAAVIGGVTAIFAVASKAIMGIKWLAVARTITKVARVAINVSLDASAAVVTDLISGNRVTLSSVLFGVGIGLGMSVGHKAFTFIKGRVKGIRAGLAAAPEIASVGETSAPVHEDIAVNDTTRTKIEPSVEPPTAKTEEHANAGGAQKPVEPVLKNNAHEIPVAEANKDLKGPHGETPKPEAFKDLDSDIVKLREKAANPENVKEVTDPAYKDNYDAEVEVGEHKFRRDKLTRKWCRFSDPVCNLENLKEVNGAADEALANKDKVKPEIEEAPAEEQPLAAEKPALPENAPAPAAKAKRVRKNRPPEPPAKPGEATVGKKNKKPKLKTEEPEVYKRPEIDEPTRRYNAAQDKAIEAKNELSQKQWEYENWLKIEIKNRKPGWLQTLKARKEAYESALIGKESAENEAAHAEQIFKDSKTPLVEKVRAIAERQRHYIAVRDNAKGIDRISGRPTPDVTVDHIIAISRIVKKLKYVVKDIRDIVKIVNDPRNLIAMHGPANYSKGENMWGEWRNARSFYPEPGTVERMSKMEREVEPIIDQLIDELFSQKGKLLPQ